MPAGVFTGSASLDEVALLTMRAQARDAVPAAPD